MGHRVSVSKSPPNVKEWTHFAIEGDCSLAPKTKCMIHAQRLRWIFCATTLAEGMTCDFTWFDIMDNFLHGNTNFMNETFLNEHRLIFMNNTMSNRRYPIRINFSCNFKQDVNTNDQSKLPDGSMHLTLGMRENAKLKTQYPWYQRQSR